MGDNKPLSIIIKVFIKDNIINNDLIGIIENYQNIYNTILIFWTHVFL